MHRATAALIACFCHLSAGIAEPIERDQIWVKDGDTIIRSDGLRNWSKAQEYRLVDFDTPETARPRAKCPKEIEKGMRAAGRLIELLDSGKLDLTEIRCSCTDSDIQTGQCNRGRRCGRLTVNGKDVGETLIAERHAVPYHCSATRCPKPRSWC
jgi:endonuclease YncB( thermonuclease family)